MNQNFLEKIVPIENEEKRLLKEKMNKLLDDSIDDFINLRERQNNESNDLNRKMINKYNENISSQRNEDNNLRVRVRNSLRLNHEERLERIRNMEEETERLNRLIENDFIEIIV